MASPAQTVKERAQLFAQVKAKYPTSAARAQIKKQLGKSWNHATNAQLRELLGTKTAKPEPKPAVVKQDSSIAKKKSAGQFGSLKKSVQEAIAAHKKQNPTATKEELLKVAKAAAAKSLKAGTKKEKQQGEKAFNQVKEELEAKQDKRKEQAKEALKGAKRNEQTDNSDLFEKANKKAAPVKSKSPNNKNTDLDNLKEEKHSTLESLYERSTRLSGNRKAAFGASVEKHLTLKAEPKDEEWLDGVESQVKSLWGIAGSNPAIPVAAKERFARFGSGNSSNREVITSSNGGISDETISRIFGEENPVSRASLRPDSQQLGKAKEIVQGWAKGLGQTAWLKTTAAQKAEILDRIGVDGVADLGIEFKPQAKKEEAKSAKPEVEKKTLAGASVNNSPTPSSVRKRWQLDELDELDKIHKKQDEVDIDDPRWDELDEQATKINSKLDKLPGRSRIVALHSAIRRFRDTPDLDIPPEHAAFINDYMRGGYKTVNLALNGSPEIKGAEKKQALVEAEALKTALHSIQPSYKGEVHRGENRKNVVELLSKATPGDEYVEKGFLSTNRLDRGASKYGGEMSLTIHSKSGKSVKPYGHYTDKEDEVLFSPNARFKVRANEVRKGKHHVELEEV